MRFGLSALGRKYLADPVATRAALTVPALVWEAPSQADDDADGDTWLLTDTGGPMTRPRSGEPLVFLLEKTPGSKNPFAMGVTVGRVDTNDVIIDDHSVSRFHAWFQHDARKDAWTLVDAESKNGTFLDGFKLPPNAKMPVIEGSTIKFGDCTVRYFSPEALLRFLQKTAGMPVDALPRR